MFGPYRAEGRSPIDFGSDDVVGLATVCQVGGELARGAVELLGANNRYGASALVRQLVEVEYLAAAFSEKGDEIAGEWMRADREERKKFWSRACSASDPQVANSKRTTGITAIKGGTRPTRPCRFCPITINYPPRFYGPT
jgi:hypothetical protein